MKTLTAKEVVEHIDLIGPSLGYDYTHQPVFPKHRDDVCAVVRTAENGSTYGFDTVYLVWKNSNGSINCKEIRNSRSTKDYIHIKSVTSRKNGNVSVKFGSGGSYSGAPWKETVNTPVG